MPGGITLSSSNVSRVRQTFHAYCEENKRDRDFLARDQARKLATDLYVETAAIAPSEGDIASKVRSLGWKIPTRFADGRLARGTKAQWVGTAWERIKPKRRKGRPSKRSLKAEQKKLAAFLADYGDRPTLEQMQAFVIRLRTQARLYLASGWLGAVVRLGGAVKARGGGDPGSGKVDFERGGAFVTRANGLISITFWNRTPGIEKMQAKHDFVGKALRRRVADMWKYIHERRARRAARLAQKG